MSDQKPWVRVGSAGIALWAGAWVWLAAGDACLAQVLHPSQFEPPRGAPSRVAPPPPPAQPSGGYGAAPPSDAGRIPLSLSAAVHSALQQHPTLVQARGELDSAEARLRQGRGAFDTLLGTNLAYNRSVNRFDGDTATTHVTRWGISADKRLIWGTALRATVDLSNTDGSQRGGPGLKAGGVNLTLTQPLLRGAGRDAAGVEVLTNEQLRRVAGFNLEHAAQTLVFEVIAAYWQLVAAEQSLILAQTSFARAQKILDETRVLVEADQRPRGDLRALEGNLANRRSGVLGAQSQRLRALAELRLAMGLDVRTRVDWEATDALPQPAPPRVPLETLTRQALSARRDIKAAEASVASSAAQYRGADHNTLPDLTATVNVGYAGVLEDPGLGAYFGTLGDPIGVNAGVILALQLPVENNRQGGARDEAAAALRIARSALFDRVRTVRSEVSAAFDELGIAIELVVAAREAEQRYEQALGDERYKLRAGLSTVIDVVLTEDLLTSAIAARISAQQQLAVTLAQLYFAVGALPSSEQAVAASLPAVMENGSTDAR